MTPRSYNELAEICSGQRYVNEHIQSTDQFILTEAWNTQQCFALEAIIGPPKSTGDGCVSAIAYCETERRASKAKCGLPIRDIIILRVAFPERL
uniref:Uncharacterized protein n=1 Tax=Ascaris lumbricoides TaxID=6252 RepID=A0A0M3HYB0_ASCLU